MQLNSFKNKSSDYFFNANSCITQVLGQMDLICFNICQFYVRCWNQSSKHGDGWVLEPRFYSFKLPVFFFFVFLPLIYWFTPQIPAKTQARFRLKLGSRTIKQVSHVGDSNPIIQNHQFCLSGSKLELGLRDEIQTQVLPRGRQAS